MIKRSKDNSIFFSRIIFQSEWKGLNKEPSEEGIGLKKEIWKHWDEEEAVHIHSAAKWRLVAEYIKNRVVCD